MAYDSSNVSWEANTYLNHYIWNYSTTDNLLTVQSSEYFLAPVAFRVGDILRVSAGDGNALYQVISGDPSSGTALRKLAIVSSFVNSVSGP